MKEITINYSIKFSSPIELVFLFINRKSYRLKELNKGENFSKNHFVSSGSFVLRTKSLDSFNYALKGVSNFSSNINGTIHFKINNITFGERAFSINSSPMGFTLAYKTIYLPDRYRQAGIISKINYIDAFDLETLDSPMVEEVNIKKSNSKKDPGGEVTLFYGTNRKVTGNKDSNDFFGSELDDLKYGTCTISIPSGHKQGKIERPSKLLWFERKENKEKHIVLSAIKEYDNADFHNLLKISLAKCEGKSALIFIHGYNNTFAEAAWRCGQIAYDIPFNGLSGFFSWPSDGKKLSYLKDIEKADASIPKLEKFIEDLVIQTGAENLHIIAHSMGNRILTRALQNLNVKPEFQEHIKTINQIVLAAPDIDRNVFNDSILPGIQNIGARRTLYASDKDTALKKSKFLRGGMLRIGEAGENIYIAEGLDTVDASNVMSEGNHHSYIFETKELLADMYILLTQGLDPVSRRLREQKKETLSYWLFRE